MNRQLPSLHPDLSHITPRRAVGVVLVCTLLVLLAGCQSIGRQVDELAQQGWTETRQTVSRFTRSLRPAPEDQAVFTYTDTGADTGDAALNTHRLQERVWVAGLRAGAPVAHREAVNRSVDNGVTVYRPGRERTVIRTAPLRPAPAFRQVQPVQPALQSASDPFSYVRLGGPTDMRDWQLCEARVGGAFIVAASGAVIAPDFDACMRARGYLPEGEAEQRLQRAPERMGELAGGLRGTFRP